MNTMQAGENITLITPQVKLSLSWEATNKQINTYLFPLDNQDKAVIQTINPDFIHIHSQQAGTQQINMDLSKIPEHTHKIRVVIYYEQGLIELNRLQLSINSQYAFLPTPQNLKTLILGEFYLRNGQWKFKALGQGYQQDIYFIANQYGAAVNNNSVSLHLPLVETKDDFFSIVREELPLTAPQITAHDVRSFLRLIKNFSLIWLLASFAVFIFTELVLAELIMPRFINHSIPYSFRYVLEVFLLILSLFTSGAIIGLISPQIRLLEPAIAGLLSMTLLLSTGFFSPSYRFIHYNWLKLIIGGSIAFILAYYGARFGEIISAKLGNRVSKQYFEQ